MKKLDQVYTKMIDYYTGYPSRIQHFTKVHSYSALIGRLEGLDERTLEILEATAYLHDIGIKPAEEVYGSYAGKYQEELGPAPARQLLSECGYDADFIERACYLVAHHHTYDNIDGLDYQILVEADFLVNLFEDDEPITTVQSVYEKIFKTKTGKEICKKMFGL